MIIHTIQLVTTNHTVSTCTRKWWCNSSVFINFPGRRRGFPRGGRHVATAARRSDKMPSRQLPAALSADVKSIEPAELSHCDVRTLPNWTFPCKYIKHRLRLNTRLFLINKSTSYRCTAESCDDFTETIIIVFLKWRDGITTEI